MSDAVTETSVPYGPDRTTLAETGQILVTARAADEYARAVELEEHETERARRELLELLMPAKRVKGEARTGAEQWRARSRTTGLDIHAHVARDGPILIVTTVRVRRYG